MSNKDAVLSLQKQEMLQEVTDVDCESLWITTITTVMCTWSTASNNCRNN